MLRLVVVVALTFTVGHGFQSPAACTSNAVFLTVIRGILVVRSKTGCPPDSTSPYYSPRFGRVAVSANHQQQQHPRTESDRFATTTTTTSTRSSSSSNSRCSKGQPPPPLLVDLQHCVTPEQLLDRVGRHVSTRNDPDGSLASRVLVRLSKMLITLDNNNKYNNNHQQQKKVEVSVLATLTEHLASRPIILCGGGTDHPSSSNLESLVDGTKACSILARLLLLLLLSSSEEASLPSPVSSSSHADCWWEPVTQMWHRHDDVLAIHPGVWQDHQLSGLHWAMDNFQLAAGGDSTSKLFRLPESIQRAYMDLNLPFRIYPGLLQPDLPPVEHWMDEVDFGVDEILLPSSSRTQARSNVVAVPERRQTAWQGDDDHVAPFCYSGKCMPRRDWSRSVRSLRDRLWVTTNQYYDGCLLNLYPDGQSGMRYHVDPDQGTIWDYDTAVVSVGATRRLAFRRHSPNHNHNHSHGGAAAGAAARNQHHQPHNFVVMHGDVMHMFGDCQERFQHAVKNADDKQETAPRMSLVFKRSWGCQKPKYGGEQRLRL